MKKIWFMMLMILSTGCVLVAVNTWYQNWSVPVQTEVAREVIRFHVRANSEDDEDQWIKMQVKNEVVAYLQPVLEGAHNDEEAYRILQSHLPEIRQISENVLKQNGFSYGADVFFSEEHFPQKTYGDCTFPAGVYPALVIELGSGQGHNWWCMLYPGLCFASESYGVVSEEKKEDLKNLLTEDAYEWIIDPKHRKITFRWEWLRKVLEFDAQRG